MGINAGAIRTEGYYKSLLRDPLMPPRPRTLERSRELWAKAARLIPSGTQTFSKVAARNTIHLAGERPVRGVARLAPVALSGVLRR